MKDVMRYFAKCNRAVNEAMHEIIRKNVADPYDLKLEGYFFKRLGDVLDHLYVTDMIWMKAFSDISAFGMDLAGDVGDVPAYGARVFGDFAAYEAAMAKLDAFILEYVNRLDEGFFLKKVSRRMKDG